MASSYLNIVTFLLTTIFYYMVLKPHLTYDILSNTESYKSYVSSNYLYLAVYLLLVMVIQFIVNSSVISSTCGGSISENMGSAALLTFVTWLLIFGVTIIILVIYPGFKSAFSDVIGYYYVSSSANNLLTKLMVDPDVNNALKNNNLNQPSLATPNNKEIQEVADLILKICGNTSILINQMVPENFESYWKLLDPLKKDEYKGSNGDDLRNQIFDLVVIRNNIGEMFWYIYTGILLTSIVQLKISSLGCDTNPKIMEANYAEFQKQEAATQKQNDASSSTTYTITN